MNGTTKNGSTKNPDLDEKKVMCGWCSKELNDRWSSLSPVFSCSECGCMLCLVCFIEGREPGKHSRKHGYRIRSSRPELTADGWTGRDDLALLDGIDRLGLGNWTRVAEAVGRGHSPDDCEGHYLEVFAGSYRKSTPPRYRLENGSWHEDEASEMYRRVIPQPSMSDVELQARHGALVGADLFGYMPLRGDFDVEHDNNAEALVADMEIRPDDDDADKALKRQVLRAYDSKLDDREARKRFVVDRGLLDERSRRTRERATRKDQRVVERHLGAFARFRSDADHYKLVRGVVDATRLESRVSKLTEKIKNRPILVGGGPHHQYHHHPQQQQHTGKHLAQYHQNGGTATPTTTTNGRKRRRRDDDDGLQLSSLEQRICEALQLPPRKYLEVKEALTTGAFTGRGSAASFLGARHHIDVDKAAKLYDFALSAGWIPPPRKQPQLLQHHHPPPANSAAAKTANSAAKTAHHGGGPT